MANEFAKFKNSNRRHKNDVAISRQVKIAKQNGLTHQDKSVKQPHRLAKHHAMDCGQPGCILCGNPRKLFKELTTQEKRLFQNLDSLNHHHSNGLTNEDNSE